MSTRSLILPGILSAAIVATIPYGFAAAPRSADPNFENGPLVP